MQFLTIAYTLLIAGFAAASPVELSAREECNIKVCPDHSVCMNGFPKNGHACVLREPCAGFLGLECRAGYTCVDNPQDDCDPKNGGSDCIGVCFPGKPYWE